MKTKYLDKLYLPNNYVVIEDFGRPEDKIISFDIKEALSKIGNKYLKLNKSFVKLSIYNLSADGLAILGRSSIIDSKDILAKHAYHRYIFLSPSLDQIYSEVFFLKCPEDIKEFEGILGFYNCYDYGILYGDYKLYHRGETTKTNYLEKELTKNNSGQYGILDISVYNEESVNDIHKIIDFNNDIRCCYFSTILNKEKVRDTELEDWFYDEDFSCIPVATFMK